MDGNGYATPRELIGAMRTACPEALPHADIVGHWVWVTFAGPPAQATRNALRELGFHWNHGRGCWQHPCGRRSVSSNGNPRARYGSVPATELEEATA